MQKNNDNILHLLANPSYHKKKNNLLIGAQIGTTAYFLLEKDTAIRKKGYQIYGHAVTDLINGKIDAVLGESTGTLFYQNQNKPVFEKIKMGQIKIEIFKRYKLEDAINAHKDLESRKIIGPAILIP